MNLWVHGFFLNQMNRNVLDGQQTIESFPLSPW